MAGSHFGWSLSDVENPKRNGLFNFRYNMIRHNEKQIEEEELDPDSTTWTGRYLRWNSEMTLSIDDQMVTPCRQISQGSDSCFGSDFPSITSTVSNYSECSPALDVTVSSNSSSIRRLRPRAVSIATLASKDDQSSDCWEDAFRHALAVMEAREDKMSSLFHELRDIRQDLSGMTDRLGHVTSSLKRYKCQQNYSRHRRYVGSCLNFHCFSEEEMVNIIHRILKRICEIRLARHEGRHHIALLI